MDVAAARRAVRAVRTSPAFERIRVAGTATTVAGLSAAVAVLTPRGRCAQIAATLAAGDARGPRLVALASTVRAPSTVWNVAASATPTEMLAVAGPLMWAATPTENASAAQRVALAADPRCPRRRMLALAADPAPDVRIAAVNNRACLRHWARALRDDELEHYSVRDQAGLTCAPFAATQPGSAADPGCPVERLETFAAHRNLNVRAAVAANPSCPPELRGRLAHDPDPDVRAALASNPNSSQRLLTSLSGSDRLRVRAAAAANPNCHPETLRWAVLESGHKAWVQPQAAANPNCPLDLIEQLAAHDDPETRRDAATNPNCPPKTLTILGEDPETDVRAAAAANPNFRRRLAC